MKILIVDDHALFREGLRHVLLQLDKDGEILEAGQCDEAFKLTGAHPDIDLVLLDLSLPGMDGLAGLATFREQFPDVPVVVMSGSEERHDVQSALDNGALGYIPKSSTSQVMLSALRLVFSGGVYIPSIMLSATGMDGAPKLGGLTDRQLAVLRLLAEGKSNKLIGRELDLAEGTVKIHISSIFRTLNVGNRTEAVVAARKLGLFSPPSS